MVQHGLKRWHASADQVGAVCIHGDRNVGRPGLCAIQDHYFPAALALKFSPRPDELAEHAALRSRRWMHQRNHAPPDRGMMGTKILLRLLEGKDVCLKELLRSR